MSRRRKERSPALACASAAERWHPSASPPSPRSFTLVRRPSPGPRPPASPRPRTSPVTRRLDRPRDLGRLAILAFLGVVGVVSAFSRYTDGLPPVDHFDKIGFSEQSIIYDRTGKIELARFGGERRRSSTFEDIPPIVVDAQTAVEDKTFWDERRLRPAGDRRRPASTASAATAVVRPRSPSSSSASACSTRTLVQDPNRTFERKLKEIIQSIRLTEAYPGDEGKQQIIAAYLNQNYYGNQAYGVKAAAKAYFGIDDLVEAHARPGGDPRRPPEVAVELRPREERRSSC